MPHRRYLIPFRSLLLPQVFTDTLVIGAGVAGIRAAIEAAQHGDVIVLVKDSIDISSTAMAQGGIAAAVDPEDTIKAHAEDTIVAGAGLCDPDVVDVLVQDGPERIKELLSWGMRFDRNERGEIDLGREGGHHCNRILHTDGASTGRELVRTLHDRLKANERVRIFERCFALDLLSANGDRGSNRIRGAITHHPRFGLQIIWARSTILATGGAGQLYRETTNPSVATADGVAMAWRAGANVADLEFIQFHPTTLYVAGSGRALITETIRGEGAYLTDRSGRRFMLEYHEMAELAPRDVVSRAIIDQLARSRDSNVFIDVRHLDQQRFAARFPDFVRLLRSFDLDPASDLIPAHPSAHYTVGGVWCDIDGRTSLPGLYACGEASANGLHGANRLASNSLLEGLVFGRRAALTVRDDDIGDAGPISINSDIRESEHAELDLNDVRSSLRSAMWRHVGIERTGTRLEDVADMFEFWCRYTMQNIFDDPIGWETQNMLTVGSLITKAARWRRESRGVHYRLDHPSPDDAFLMRASWNCRGEEPILQTLVKPVEATVP
jgi:L-aspartate oxidase